MHGFEKLKDAKRSKQGLVEFGSGPRRPAIIYTNLVNNLEFLKSVYRELENAGICVYVFGGWAEELQNVIVPREHKDIDLLYPSIDFSLVDKFITQKNLKLIKRFPHKRAFSYKEIMVEIFLVQDGITTFFSTYRHEWLNSTLKSDKIEDMRICSIECLNDYREKHHFVEEASVNYFK